MSGWGRGAVPTWMYGGQHAEAKKDGTREQRRAWAKKYGKPMPKKDEQEQKI